MIQFYNFITLVMSGEDSAGIMIALVLCVMDGFNNKSNVISNNGT